MRFTAELIINRNVQDSFGEPAEAAISTLKYEVAFRLQNEDDMERLVLTEERLDRITQADAKRTLGFPRKRSFTESCIKGRRTTNFVSTGREQGEPVVQVHQEGHGGRRLSAPKSQQTVIGGLASSDYPTVLAVHREMQSWQTLLLEPSAMRAPSFYEDPRMIDPRGGNLAGAIFRLQKVEKSPGSTCAELANRLSELIEDVEGLRVRDDPKTETLTLEVKGRTGVFHPARSLSDGTLRFLVLATLAQDPQTQGVICLEEPENGIHPDRIPNMIRLLKDIAVDPDYAVDENNPLRQVIVNTHSPMVFQNIAEEDLVYIEEERTTVDGKRGSVAEIRLPKRTWRAQQLTPDLTLSPRNVRSYLGDAVPSENKQMWLDYCEGELAGWRP
jgi:hypothetical protein